MEAGTTPRPSLPIGKPCKSPYEASFLSPSSGSLRTLVSPRRPQLSLLRPLSQQQEAHAVSTRRIASSTYWNNFSSGAEGDRHWNLPTSKHNLLKRLSSSRKPPLRFSKFPGTTHGGSTPSSRIAVTALSLPQLSLPADAQLWATLSALFSKFLGYLVICGSMFLKVPQILRVLRNRSVDGLNRFSFETECLGYTMALAYCVNKGVPFYVYGELFFILGQALILMTCIYKFSPPCNWTKLKVPLYIVISAILFSGHLPPHLLETMYSMQTTMFTMARLPQIWSNICEGSTGELSATTYCLSVTGCAVRLYTSIFSNAPTNMVISSIAGLCTHGTLLAQILVYESRKNLKVDRVRRPSS